MTRQDKKRYLYSYYWIDETIKNLQDEYDTLFAQATKVTPTESDGSQHTGNTDSKVEKYAVKLAEIESKLAHAKHKKKRIETEVRRLKPHQRYLVEMVEFKHVPVWRVAKIIDRDPETIRHNLRNIIDKMFLDNKEKDDMLKANR